MSVQISSIFSLPGGFEIRSAETERDEFLLISFPPMAGGYALKERQVMLLVGVLSDWLYICEQKNAGRPTTP